MHATLDISKSSDGLPLRSSAITAVLGSGLKNFLKMPILTVVILMFALTTTGQSENNKTNSLSLQYNDTWIGRNISMTYGYMFSDKWRIYGGFKYHINSNRYHGDIVPLNNITPGEHALYYRVYPSNFAQHFGLKAGVERLVPISNNADVLLFYDFQYAPRLDYEGGGGGVDSNYNSRLITPFPFYAIQGRHFQEHTVGCGISLKATNRLGIRAQVGVGGVRHSSYANPVVWYEKEIMSDRWKFIRMVGLGMDYSFISRKTSERPKKRNYYH